MKRRDFLGLAGVSALAFGCGLPTGCDGAAEAAWPEIANREPARALVAWYSQTGHTERLAKLVAATLRAEGLEAEAVRARDVRDEQIAAADLVILGSPVFYMDIPEGMQRLLARLPSLAGKTGAAFVTFGGEGTNEQNTSVRLLRELAARGASPVGCNRFSNMSAFAPTWSNGNPKRTLRYRHLPNEQTYDEVRAFARKALAGARAGEVDAGEMSYGWEEWTRIVDARWMTKAAIGRHAINAETCIKCGACEKTCPVGAIELASRRIDDSACVVCLGCVNNCPTGALEMEMLGTRLEGFRRFCERFDISFTPPRELA
jgi:ferredoxin/menaquinone-dependent protoporphyrinogen IX oxidase